MVMGVLLKMLRRLLFGHTLVHQIRVRPITGILIRASPSATSVRHGVRSTVQCSAVQCSEVEYSRVERWRDGWMDDLLFATLSALSNQIDSMPLGLHFTSATG